MANQNSQDRSEQVLKLLMELSDRLRRAENERDTLNRELARLRDMVQDLDDRNSQTQKAYLGLENKFDAADTTTETIIRRVTGMEEMLDRQSGEMIGILRKIEERFESYDREYKNHAASIAYYGDQLDKFDKRLDKLMADKGRMSRKLDALEFHVVDIDDRVKTGRAAEAADKVRAGLQIWTSDTPESRPQFMAGPSDAPTPVPRMSLNIGQILRPVFRGGLMVAGVLLALGGIYTLIQTAGKMNTGAIKETQVAQGPTVSSTPETAPEKGRGSKSDEPLFSSTIRAQMDAQMVAAKKLEDADTARLSTTTKKPAALKPDATLPRVIQAIEARAFEGNAEAQHDMGALYISGQSGVGVDYARAGYWFRLAAIKGVANARYNLGVLYQQGLGVEKDVGTAMSWYRAAALLNHPEARYNLGIAYVEGIGVAYNPAMAAAYFEQAAMNGVMDAAYNLGSVLENGLVDEARPHEAMFWYQLAARRGSAEGALALKKRLSEEGMGQAAWDELFEKMLAARPDVKPLATPAKQSPHTAPRVRGMKSDEASDALDISAVQPMKKVAPPPAPKLPVTESPPVSAQKAAPQKTPDQTLARIQTILADEGLFGGAPTGEMSALTADAITRYQTKYGLAVDGQPSEGLLALMLARRLSIDTQPAAGKSVKPKMND